MDVVRVRPRVLKKWMLPAAGVAILAVLMVWALASLLQSRAAIAVDRTSVLIDVARVGPLVLSVNAQGIFAPQYERVVSATQSGVVNQVFIKAGSVVAPGTVIAQMQNPTLTAAADNASAALRVAEASLASAREEGRASVITQQTQEDDAEAGHAQDALQAGSLAMLHGKGLIADIPYRTAQIQAQKSANELRASRAQVGVAGAEAQAKIAAAEAQVEEAETQLSADEAQVAALTIRAATAGIAQSVDVDPGTSIAQGAQIARIADVTALKAVLQVAESDAHAILVGMPVRVDDVNASAEGRVARIAPTAQNGTVAVDVTFLGLPPAGARPAANAQGIILLATIPNAVSIARPAGASDGTAIDIFKVVDGGTLAVRTRVTLGRGSYDRVQVINGVRSGDSVIVSDMSSFTDKPQLQLR
jgi:HlyD family secretion protein